jgi:hypothetical protein
MSSQLVLGRFRNYLLQKDEEAEAEAADINITDTTEQSR